MSALCMLPDLIDDSFRSNVSHPLSDEDIPGDLFIVTDGISYKLAFRLTIRTVFSARHNSSGGLGVLYISPCLKRPLYRITADALGDQLIFRHLKRKNKHLMSSCRDLIRHL